MDKNNIIGFVLIAAVLIGYGIWQQPSAEEQAAYAARQDSIARVEQKKQSEAQAAKLTQEAKAMPTDSTALFFAALKGEAKDVVLKNEHVELTINTKGAVVNKAVVKNFKSIDGTNNVTLFDNKDHSLNFSLLAKETNINTSELYFEPSAVSDSTVTLTADAGAGRSLVISYTIGKDYMLHMQMRANGMKGLFAPSTDRMDVAWNERCRQQESGYNFENRYSTLTYHFSDGDTDHLSETGSETGVKVEEKIDWVAFKSQFFSAMMIAKDDFGNNAELTSVMLDKKDKYLKQYGANLKAFFDPSGERATEIDFFYGPNDYRLLKRMEEQSTFGKDLEMQRLVYLGWPLFRIINRWFTIYVFDFLTSLNINMGIVLILITLLLKVITYPMVKKSYMSSAKMRVLKPKLEEATKHLNKPEDQMQKQQAMMMEYSKYGVSPLGGCLPMLIQFPIWVAMFNFVPNAIQLRGESFLWINDLSTYDPFIEWNKDLWLIGDHVSLTCVLFCVSNILYSFMTMRQQRDQMVGQQAEQMKMMQWMMYLMPVMFFFMFNDYSSGLNFYYFISLFFSAAIMWILRKTTDDAKLLALLEKRYEENKKNPKKATGFAARLQALQEQQRLELERKREELEKKKQKLRDGQ